jgi:hypothetical protein
MNADMVANLIGALGQSVILRRNSLAANGVQISFDVKTRAALRKYAASDLIGNSGFTLGEREARIAVQDLAKAQWPAPPRKGDGLVVDGVECEITAVQVLNVGDEVVGYVLTIRGNA